MRIIPAIDIIDGKCVRLTKGDYTTKKIYNEQPIEVAKEFEAAGIEYLHVVDLDGAKVNLDGGAIAFGVSLAKRHACRPLGRDRRCHRQAGRTNRSMILHSVARFSVVVREAKPTDEVGRRRCKLSRKFAVRECTAPQAHL